jgi:hypothetical protein
MKLNLYLTELCRPWKLATLSIGMVWLIWGSYYYQASDWDIGICFVMAFFTYITSPWCLRTFLDAYHFQKLSWSILGALFAWYWSVDGCYWIYHTRVGNEMIRYENFFASTGLYFMCAIIWLHNGTLADLWQKIRTTEITLTNTTKNNEQQ